MAISKTALGEERCNHTSPHIGLSLSTRTSKIGNPNFEYFGDEDCLFLDVLSPANASSIPVYVWIRGGCCSLGQGNHDLTQLIDGNSNSFVGVLIQYRLAAFGFLSSDEVARFEALNVGLLGRHFSLKWVQLYISMFGGDPRRVSISGASTDRGGGM